MDNENYRACAANVLGYADANKLSISQIIMLVVKAGWIPEGMQALDKAGVRFIGSNDAWTFTYKEKLRTGFKTLEKAMAAAYSQLAPRPKLGVYQAGTKIHTLASANEFTRYGYEVILHVTSELTYPTQALASTAAELTVKNVGDLLNGR